MQHPAHAPSQNFGLNLVRSAAILAVLFSHSTDWWLGPGLQTAFKSAVTGALGVEVFFSLSGFLIGGILLRSIHAGGFGPHAMGLFWTRRWMRTLPAYWVMLLLLNWHFGTADWRSFLFLQNFVSRTEWTPLTPHTWSLTLEEWFYLFVPIGTWAALAAVRRTWALPVLCVALIAGCTAGRWLVGTEPAPFWGPQPGQNPILRLDCAAWGVLAACLVRGRPLGRGAAWGALLAGVALVAALGFVSLALYEPERLVPWGLAWWARAWGPLHPSLEGLAAAGVVLGLHRLLPHEPPVLGAAAGAVSALAYSLYLVHVPVMFLCRAAGVDDAAGWGARLSITLAVVGAALAMRYGVERPVLALRDRVAPDRQRPQPALAAAG